MEDLACLAPFIAALQRIVREPEACQPADDALDQKFLSLVQEEVTRAEPRGLSSSTSHVLPFPVTTVALLRPKASPTTGISVNRRTVSSTELNICRPQPDEWFQGWQGRMRAINGQPDNLSLASLIAEIVCHRSESTPLGADFLDHAALILGMSRDSLIKHHTLLPFFGALEGLRPCKPGTKSVRHRQAYERNAPFRQEGQVPRYCQRCAREEYSANGYSYWHRDHQLPGMIWCPKHGTALASVDRQNAFEQRPHEITDAFIDGRLDTLTDAQAAVLNRYAQIAKEVLNLASVIDSASASKVLGEGARAAGLRVSKAGKRPTVSSQLLRQLPGWWLSEAFPRVRWAPDKYISTIDAACVPGATRYTTATLCLLAALLYEDAGDAIAKVLSPSDSAPDRTRGFDFWASKVLLDAYIAHGGVVSRVAEQLNLPPSTVAIGLLNQGLPGLGKLKNSGTIMAARAFLEGQSPTAASAGNEIVTAELLALVRAACPRLKTALDAILDGAASSMPPEKRRATG